MEWVISNQLSVFSLSRAVGTAAVVALCCLLTGCPNAVRPGPEVTGPRTPAEAAGTSSSAPVDLSISPSPPEQLKPSTFTVTSHPSLGEGAVVAITLTMPSMAMPATRIQTHPAGSGVYQGTGAFSMSGDWQAEISITTSGKRLTKLVRITVK